MIPKIDRTLKESAHQHNRCLEGARLRPPDCSTDSDDVSPVITFSKRMANMGSTLTADNPSVDPINIGRSADDASSRQRLYSVNHFFNRQGILLHYA